MADVRVTKVGAYVEMQPNPEVRVTVVGMYVEMVELQAAPGTFGTNAQPKTGFSSQRLSGF